MVDSSTRRVLFAINEATGTMKTFGSFRSLEAAADRLAAILSDDDPVKWPDGWTPYLYEKSGGAFGHPHWWTPNPEGTLEDGEWLPVGFDPFVDLPLKPMFQTVRGDAINENGQAYDAWIIETRAPTLGELLRAEWRQPSREDLAHFDLDPRAVVAEVGDLLAFAKPVAGGKVELQVHGTDKDGHAVFWRAEMGPWQDFA